MKNLISIKTKNLIEIKGVEDRKKKIEVKLL